MSKKIYCSGCQKLVGKVQAGSLLAKGLVYTCQDCYRQPNVFKEELSKIKAKSEFFSGLKGYMK